VSNVEFVEEVGGGLNLKRPKFLTLMDRIEARQVSYLIIAHKARLVRIGFSWFERFCAEHRTRVAGPQQRTASPEQEMVQDLLSNPTLLSLPFTDCAIAVRHPTSIAGTGQLWIANNDIVNLIDSAEAC
jgi:predicted site-specific integrase-resolvase